MKKAIYKNLINWYQAADKPLPRWLENACAKDEGLALEKELGDSLTEALGKGPSEDALFGESSMSARVMRQITEEDYEAEKEETRSSWGGILRTASYAVAACFVAVAVFNFTNNEEGPIMAQEEVPAVITVGQSTDLSELGSELLAMQNPLDQEIEYMIQDAKGALGFLTDSFVPSGLRKGSADSDDQA